jgi:hypothetical protein
MGDEPLHLWDGEVVIRLDVWEARMSHWIRTPTAIDGRTGRVVLDLAGTAWDLVSAQADGDVATLTLRRYPNGNDTAIVRIARDGLALTLDGGPVTPEQLRGRLTSVRRRGVRE